MGRHEPDLYELLMMNREQSLEPGLDSLDLDQDDEDDAIDYNVEHPEG